MEVATKKWRVAVGSAIGSRERESRVWSSRECSRERESQKWVANGSRESGSRIGVAKWGREWESRNGVANVSREMGSRMWVAK